MDLDKELIKKRIQELVEKYEIAKKDGKLKSYSEEDTKKDFILPLFKILGWDTENKNKNEVFAEENIVGAGRPDYSFKINDRVQFYLEAKKLSVDLHEEKWAHQSISYSWNKGVTWAILTDFENLKVFNAEVIDKDLIDKLLFDIPYDKFIDRFDQLFLLSKEAFQNDLINKYAEEHGKKLQKVSVSSLLYKDLNESRELLTKSFSNWNKNVDKDLIDEGVQKILDRLIFIRVAEDRGIEPKTLIPLVREWESSKSKKTLFEYMIPKFRELDDYYNSNLFSEHFVEKWQEYDNTIKDVIQKLYGKKGYYEYDFKIMPADVLGAVYENYLGYKLSKSKQGLTLAKDAKKRKEQGIYYTPSYIVDYIVKNALKPVLDNCKGVADLKKIKVLDPACGSGSFLLKALELISDKYKEFGYKQDDFTKQMILIENIYGVDLDQQAVDIARLNLLVASLDKRQKLPDLNIKNGNSLISGTDEELKKYFGPKFRDKKPFNWQEKFPEVFKQGGFDVIIGNPPWGANITVDSQYLSENYPNSTKEKKDTYKTFIDKAIQLLKASGSLGFVVPNSFLYQPSYEDIKEIVESHSYKVINLGEKIFAGVELPSCILILKKDFNKTGFIIDLTQENRESLPKVLMDVDFDEYKKLEKGKSRIIKKTLLIFDDVFELKDAGIQYHRSGIGLSNKGGNDLYERIFCDKSENKFRNIKETWYGKLISRYFITDETDEFFNLDYKSILNKNESVSFTKGAFEEKEKILWRQTAASPLAVLDTKGRWFRNTIQCGYFKDAYKNKVNLLYALTIFNSQYINYVYRRMVLETGRVFPQVKIKYLKQLPFIIPAESIQQYLADLAKKMLELTQQIQATQENSNKWENIKSEIEKTDKKIDEEIYKLYGLTDEEIKVIEDSSKK